MKPIKVVISAFNKNQAGRGRPKEGLVAAIAPSI